MWGDIENLLMTINSATWVAYLAGLVLACTVVNCLSYRIGLAVWLSTDLIKVGVTPYMYSLSEISKELARLVWYPSFMLMSLISMYLMLHFHRRFNTKPERESSIIFGFIAALFCLNAIRFFDRIIFNTDQLADFYKFGVLAIKVWAVFAIFLHIWSIRSREQGVC